jgi:hypothetical protein
MAATQSQQLALNGTTATDTDASVSTNSDSNATSSNTAVTTTAAAAAPAVTKDVDYRKLMNLLLQLRKVCNHPHLLTEFEPVPESSSLTASSEAMANAAGIAVLQCSLHIFYISVCCRYSPHGHAVCQTVQSLVTRYSKLLCQNLDVQVSLSVYIIAQYYNSCMTTATAAVRTHSHCALCMHHMF